MCKVVGGLLGVEEQPMTRAATDAALLDFYPICALQAVIQAAFVALPNWDLAWSLSSNCTFNSAKL